MHIYDDPSTVFDILDDTFYYIIEVHKHIEIL